MVLAGVAEDLPFRDDKFDLVLMDVMMPHLDGGDLYSRFKEHPDLTKTPVVFLTAHGSIEKAVEAVRLGACDFIEKPPESERILIVARNALGQKRLEQSLGDFAVSYELLAWTGEPKLSIRTASALRQNVIDRFNDAGVEIMTPVVNAVRNSVEPAIPENYVVDATPRALSFLGLQGGTA